MAKIKDERQYEAACGRINELLLVVNNSTPADDGNLLELDLLAAMVEEYEHEHYPVKPPTLAEVLKLRMAEMGLTQAKLSEMLGISPARVSDLVTGKCEPTLKIGRAISKKLDIPPSVILGV